MFVKRDKLNVSFCETATWWNAYVKFFFLSTHDLRGYCFENILKLVFTHRSTASRLSSLRSLYGLLSGDVMIELKIIKS